MVPQDLIPEFALLAAAKALRERHDNPAGVPLEEIPEPARPVPWDSLGAANQMRWMSRVAPALGAALYAIDPSFADPHHVMLKQAGAWTMQHPLSCRPDLLACPVPDRVWEQDLDAGLPDGRYPVYLADGKLTVGDAL